MNNIVITKSAEETKKLGKEFAKEIKDGGVACLEGDLGAGKTTFTQGLLESLGAEGPYTSPTFVILKSYKLQAKKLKNVFHVDAYRVGAKDMHALGWDEILANSKNIVIIEWPERIADVVPNNAKRIRFEWVGENERKIVFSHQSPVISH